MSITIQKLKVEMIILSDEEGSQQYLRYDARNWWKCGEYVDEYIRDENETESLESKYQEEISK